MGVEIYTIGHSNRTMEELVALLKEFGIGRLADIRRFPGSRKFRHFNREVLEKRLPAEGIEYIWMEVLGGRRSKEARSESANLGLRSAGFRNYADYMQTQEFAAGIKTLLGPATERRTVIMCAEKLYWRCHRMLVSDYLTARGVKVLHIVESGRLMEHKLSEIAARTEGGVIYPSQKEDRQNKLFET